MQNYYDADASHKYTILLGGIPEIRPDASSQQNKVLCIKQSQQLLGPDVCTGHELFIHAIIGRDVAVKKIKRDFKYC